MLIDAHRSPLNVPTISTAAVLRRVVQGSGQPSESRVALTRPVTEPQFMQWSTAGACYRLNLCARFADNTGRRIKAKLIASWETVAPELSHNPIIAFVRLLAAEIQIKDSRLLN